MHEKPSSHKYVEEKGSRAGTALFVWETLQQQSAKNCLKVDQQSSALNQDFISYSCKVVSYPTVVELYGFQTQSRQSVESEGK